MKKTYVTPNGMKDVTKLFLILLFFALACIGSFTGCEDLYKDDHCDQHVKPEISVTFTIIAHISTNVVSGSQEKYLDFSTGKYVCGTNNDDKPKQGSIFFTSLQDIMVHPGSAAISGNDYVITWDLKPNYSLRNRDDRIWVAVQFGSFSNRYEEFFYYDALQPHSGGTKVIHVYL